MNISHHHSVGNSSRVAPASDTNQSKYLTPDYFLPASCSESYYSRKYSGNHTTNTINNHHAANTITGIKPNHQSKFCKLSRVASVMLLSLSFLATAVEVKAQSNLGASASSSSIALQSLKQQVRFQSSQQQPKKKPLLKRTAHKAAKRLGFSGVVAATRENLRSAWKS